MSFSKEEQEKIEELRRRVKDDLATKEQDDDHFLIRWLRARNMNIDKAEEMLKNSLKWRKETGADTILETEEIPEEYRKKYMFGVFGEDEEGCPIVLLPGGRHDHRYLLETVGMEKALRWNIVSMETAMKVIKDLRIASGRPVYSYHEIIDMEGYTYRSFMYKPALSFIIEMQKVFDNNYPDIVRTVSVINTPKIFSMLFSILKPFIAKETLEKVTIYGSNREEWKEAFVKRGFPLNRFPTNWGGTLEGSDEFCSQDDSVWMDAPIPLKYFKEVPEADEDGFFTVKIGARDKHEMKFPTLNNDESTTVSWKFQTEGNDISFQLSFIRDDNDNNNENDNSKEELVIPMRRVDSQKQLQQGSKTVDVKGTFVFVFDNGHSYVRSKTLKYQISLS